MFNCPDPASPEKVRLWSGPYPGPIACLVIFVPFFARASSARRVYEKAPAASQSGLLSPSAQDWPSRVSLRSLGTGFSPFPFPPTDGMGKPQLSLRLSGTFGAQDWPSRVSLRSLGTGFSPFPFPPTDGMGKPQLSLRLSGTFGAQDWTRTSTAFRPLPPQSSVSTNFTTWARFAVVGLHW